MAPFLLIETVIFAVTLPLLAYFLISKRMIFPVLAPALVSVALEIVNECVFAGEGTYYPGSLLFFPGSAFPVAIVLLSAAYSCAVNFDAAKISELSAKRYVSLSIFIVSLFLLNFCSFAVEKGGLSSGYWLPRYSSEMRTVYGYVYLFYLAVVFSGSFFFIRRIMKRGV